jgi:hypothetical protein
MFSVVNAYLFRPLPVRSGGELVALAAQKPTSNALRNLSYPNLIEVLRRITAEPAHARASSWCNSRW